jgi:hypothetical protein
MMTGVSFIMSTRGARLGIRVASSVVALLFAGSCGLAVWYRQAYNVWPGQGASARVHWCGRDYESFGGLPRTWQQITVRESAPVHAVGQVPAAWLVTPGVVRRLLAQGAAAGSEQAAGVRDGGLPAYRPGRVPGLQP